MKITVLFLLAVSTCIHARAQEADVLLPAERPREQIIHHRGFSLSYNPGYVQPSWVSYKVVGQDMKSDGIQGKYKPDPMVDTRSADKKDYRQGGYTMAQFVNCIDVNHIPDAMEETFYMTNITPMKGAYYTHIWVRIEDLVRAWARETDGLYVICGPILSDAPFPAIGENNVSVPKRYYKAVYDPKKNQAIGFICKNGMSSGSLSSYAVSIDEIEKETELDLFPALDDDTEKEVERNNDFSSWNFNLIN